MLNIVRSHVLPLMLVLVAGGLLITGSVSAGIGEAGPIPDSDDPFDRSSGSNTAAPMTGTDINTSFPEMGDTVVIHPVFKNYTDSIVVEIPTDNVHPGPLPDLPEQPEIVVRHDETIPDESTFAREETGISGIPGASISTLRSSPVFLTTGASATITTATSPVPEPVKEHVAIYTSLVRGTVRGSGNGIAPRFTPARSADHGSFRMSSGDFLATTMVGFLIMGFASVFSCRSGGSERALPFVAPLYSRISRDEVLENDTRGSIYTLIMSNPGTDLLSIKNSLGLSNGVLAHHIHTLERERYIRSVRDGRYRRFFISGTRVEIGETVESRILDVVATRSSANQSQIARELGVSRQALNYHIQKLVRRGIIVTEKVGRETMLRRMDT